MAKQTRLAVLLYLMDDNGNQNPYWFPKSQLDLRNREEIRILDGKAVKTGKTYFEVAVSQWAWEKREIAKPMGCL